MCGISTCVDGTEVVLGGIRILGDGIDVRLIPRYHGTSQYSVPFYVPTCYACYN